MENEKSTGNKYTVKDAAIIGIFCAVIRFFEGRSEFIRIFISDFTCNLRY